LYLDWKIALQIKKGVPDFRLGHSLFNYSEKTNWLEI
jgi:hypothetical protein